ncbi:leucyl/phenylalanyl-tRNA--protein transferase [Salinicola rhizosphaerae]|uniref:Leucyl/phenylalanyl-tRNA--protein transferase n=1 Tax=Salinicola rhizosphaerae TaxID=1443141 RepID=A0ABQ3E9J3_9GAMM|nr:leucyl/phenylalanyl-tRNA--protein transferase [Salinicola rhizosphaerae]GHB27667.1 leucyl/phenylalanyl-tRNA--protein transferase [Salinicola rhizosphaerae]
MLPWLPPHQVMFPTVDHALDEPEGLLAAGGALTPTWLVEAYRRGIFPWYSEEQPILWWSPDPRMVLFPAEVRVRRSLAKRMRHAGFEVTLDRDFDAVIAACAETRAGAEGTWISDEMNAAYRHLHRLGYAHSVETWREGKLVGGLYGISLGRIFFGESMFSHQPDTSKIALVHLARTLETHRFALIDCQMHTDHLASMGARDIARETFIGYLEQNVNAPTPTDLWSTEPT